MVNKDYQKARHLALLGRRRWRHYDVSRCARRSAHC